MKKILLITAGLATLAGAISLVRADDMGNMPGMKMGGMGQTNGSMQNTNTNNPSMKSYRTRGVVKKITPDRHTATIDTAKIPGYMDAMTMDYPVLDTNELKGISAGDKIKFTLVVSNDTDWIQGVRLTSHMKGGMTNSMPMQMNMPH